MLLLLLRPCSDSQWVRATLQWELRSVVRTWRQAELMPLLLVLQHRLRCVALLLQRCVA
jgi:hypothetical protein